MLPCNETGTAAQPHFSSHSQFPKTTFSSSSSTLRIFCQDFMPKVRHPLLLTHHWITSAHLVGQRQCQNPAQNLPGAPGLAFLTLRLSTYLFLCRRGAPQGEEWAGTVVKDHWSAWDVEQSQMNIEKTSVLLCLTKSSASGRLGRIS